METELDLQKFLYIEYSKKYLCAVEVPFLGRSVDFVYKNGNDYISIELKLKPNMQVIKQALDQRNGFDKVFVCTIKPKKGYTSKYIDLLKSQKLGLIQYENGQLKTILEAPKNNIQIKWIKERVKYGFGYSLKTLPQFYDWIQPPAAGEEEGVGG